MRGGIGQEIKRAATGVEIEHEIGHRHKITRDVIGDLFGDRAIGPAGKGAVEIAAIDRRGARTSPEGRIVESRQDDHPAPDCGMSEVACEIKKRDRPLILVTVIATHEKRRRPLAIPDDTDGDHHGAPGRLIPRIGQPQMAVLHAVHRIIDSGHHG